MTQQELDDTLKEHQIWIKSGGKNGKKASLEKVDLSNKVNLFAELSVHTLQDPMWNYDTSTIETIANAFFKDKEIKLVLKRIGEI